MIGKEVPGYSVPVINERGVRAGAGLLFLGGAVAFGAALATSGTAPLQPFGMYFMFDMAVRLLASDRYSPTLILGSAIVTRQKPEWVGARQKEFAWWLGFMLAAFSCASMGLFQVPLAITLVLCGLCLTLLYIEAAFGICMGCSLQRFFDRKSTPVYCPGDICHSA